MGVELWFIILLASHIVVLLIGWSMGTKRNEPIEVAMSKKTSSKKVKPYYDTVDIFNEQTMDFE